MECLPRLPYGYPACIGDTTFINVKVCGHLACIGGLARIRGRRLIEEIWYTIHLREEVRPHALFTPWNVPIPLCPKVQKELEWIEKLKVIEQVTDPTTWCTGIVVVPKWSGDVRVCVDLKPLNDGVMCETYSISTVDDSLAKLAGATIFSKVDVNSGFWQISLKE